MTALRKTAPHLNAVSAGPTKPDDAAILEAWEHDTPEFGVLFYDHLSGVIDATLYRVMGGRVVEHEDLVQTVFEQILLSLAKGKFQRACSLKSWAAAIAARVGLNAIRSRKTLRKYFSSAEYAIEPVGSEPTPSERAHHRRLLVRVRKHLSQVSPQRAEAVLLHDVLGHELAEIAAMTGVTVAAAQSRLVRGRKELHRRLEASGLREEVDRAK